MTQITRDLQVRDQLDALVRLIHGAHKVRARIIESKDPGVLGLFAERLTHLLDDVTDASDIRDRDDGESWVDAILRAAGSSIAMLQDRQAAVSRSQPTEGAIDNE